MKDENFVVVAHKFHTTPEDDLVTYLNAMGASNVLHICHSFSDAPDRRSSYRWYRSGSLVKESCTRDYRWLPEPLIYLKELVFTLRWTGSSSLKWDRYVGLDGLCTLFGLILRRRRRVTSVAYWNIDLVPKGRFAERWKDAVYRTVNRFSALHADSMWDHTPLMVEEKERILGLRPADYRSHQIVPLGIWTERIPRYRYEDCEQHTLVFMGHLLEKQGVQLVLRAVPAIIKQLPDFRFKIIGSGAYESNLRRLARDLNVENHVVFLGRVEDDQEMEREIARSSAGIAPYIRSLDTFTQFGADPGKIKTYLGCGIPILLTDVPWIASQVAERACGEMIGEDSASITERTVHMLRDGAVNQLCRDNAASFALEFDARKIFDRLGL